MGMKPALSIVISSFNRLPMFRRCLASIPRQMCKGVPYEVVVVDDGSTEDTLGEIRRYSSAFPWKFIRFSSEKFERQTGVKKFWNNPAATQNVGFRHSEGYKVCLQGNEVVAHDGVYGELLDSGWLAIHFGHVSKVLHYHLSFSTTLNVPRHIQGRWDEYGSNVTAEQVNHCRRYPLNSRFYHSDVTNYLSCKTRALWEKVGGYDERYVGGLGKEDSDFVRRCRAIPGWKDEYNLHRLDAISLHQDHGSRTPFGEQDQSQINNARWKEGEALSKAVWDQWDGSHENRQPWPWGECGVVEVLSNAS